MLKKIAWTMFFVVMFGLVFFSRISESFSDFMSSISFGIQYETNVIIHGLKIYISYIYIPFIFAILENVFKMHDRLSDLFRIRYNFDKNVIIKDFLTDLNMQNFKRFNPKIEIIS